jgi:predicted  nucleic acid-binding Zn-ribbon protein
LSISDLDFKEKNCHELIEKMLRERQELLVGIPADLLSSYERFTAIPNAAGGFRKGLVTVQNENCGGCFLKVTPQVRTKLRRGEPTVCENCGTLLYAN